MTPTTRKLQEIHDDLWGPHDPPSISGKHYVGLILDEFIQKSWILLLRSKDEFFDAFEHGLPRAESSSGEKLGCVRANGGGGFISTALKAFCEDRGMNIGYAAPYMHEENGLAEGCWRTLAKMKYSLLIDSSLPINFWTRHV